jgi:2-iminobutanoate/2-iminopropanoate deaminase
MVGRPINSDKVPVAVGGYSQALESANCSRRLYVSGQIPVRKDGTVPSTFREQARVTWQNVISQLEAAEMSVENLVKVTIFLSDRKFALENREERQAALGSHAPALTVIITGIFDESWLLEIEAIAER